MVLDAATEARIYQKLLPILGDEDTKAFLDATRELARANTLSPLRDHPGAVTPRE